MELIDGAAWGVAYPLLPELFLDKHFRLALANPFMVVSRDTAYSICLTLVMDAGTYFFTVHR